MNSNSAEFIEVKSKARSGNIVAYNVDYLLDHLDEEFVFLRRYKRFRDALNSSTDPEEITQLSLKLLELDCLNSSEGFNLS